MLYNIFPNKTPNFPCIFKINFVPLWAEYKYCSRALLAHTHVFAM